jgi:hypothetical protein
MKNAHPNIYLSKPAIYKSKITPFQLIDSGDNDAYYRRLKPPLL